MGKLTAIIIEDEVANYMNLKHLLEEYCPEVSLIGIATNVLDAVKLINQTPPQLVFLDIEMPVHNGFKLFDYFKDPLFHVIFTTAHDEYALKAIKVSALDYLLKPIDLEDLIQSIEKAKSALLTQKIQEKYRVLQSNLSSTKNIEKISIRTKEGYRFVNISDIIYCKSDENYTNFIFKDGSIILVSQTLKIFDDLLSSEGFFRVSKSCLIHLKHIERYVRQKKPMIIMSNGDALLVSPKKRELFLNIINTQIL